MWVNSYFLYSCYSENKEQILFRQTLEDEDTNVLHQKLMEVDVKLGQRIHPHDKRKIIR
jgi:tRNA A37 N6-isopentenylltransferase MiaA